MSAVLWRSWLFRATAIPLAALGIAGALDGPRYDAIIAPSGDLVAVRGADRLLHVVGKHFNAFTAEQWLAADGDGRDPARARDAQTLCDRDGCIAGLAAGRLLSMVTAPPAFEEDCIRASLVVSALAAPSDCQALTFDPQTLARTGAVGLVWDGARFRVTADRSLLEDRPWSPAPAGILTERLMAPASGGSTGADPADP